MVTFTCSYPFNGRQHVVHVQAADEIEASRKLRAIGISAQIDGELVAEIDVGRPTNLTRLLARAFGRVR